MPLDTGISFPGRATVGQPLDRRDARLKVMGRARYAAEFDIDNLVHAVLVQSTIASGEVTAFDLAAAQAVPGVLTIMTPDNAPRLPQGDDFRDHSRREPRAENDRTSSGMRNRRQKPTARRWSLRTKTPRVNLRVRVPPER